jgi:hypothetical protein
MSDPAYFMERCVSGTPRPGLTMLTLAHLSGEGVAVMPVPFCAFPGIRPASLCCFTYCPAPSALNMSWTIISPWDFVA